MVTADPGGDTAGSDNGAFSTDGLVLLNGAAEGDDPGTTTLVEPSGRVTPPLPWPVSGQFAGAIPGYVFVVSHAAHQYRFTALRLDRERLPSPRLGAARRPDPCRLLTAGRLATLGPGYTAFPAKRSPLVESLRLPHSDQCNFAGGHPFSLQIGWVAADQAGAEALTQSLLPGPERVRQAGPGGYLYTDETAGPVPVTDRALVARGRLVIDVFAPGQVDLTAKIARLLQADRPAGPGGRARPGRRGEDRA